jgi:hypothetical protein
LALITFKTRKMQQLLWHPTALRKMLRSFCKLGFRRRGIVLPSAQFQKDRKTAHTARVSMIVLREMFSKHVISRGCDFPWPARSPDLSGCVYFWWGHHNGKVFVSKPRTIEELKQRIKTKSQQSQRRWLVEWWKVFQKDWSNVWEMAADI